MKDVPVKEFINSLGHLEFPVNKQDVLQEAREHAPEPAVVEAIEKYLPDRLYYTKTELMTEYSNARE